MSAPNSQSAALTREQIEAIRNALNKYMAGFILTATDIGLDGSPIADRLCDMALAALRSEIPAQPVAWVAKHSSGTVAHLSVQDGWSVEVVMTGAPAPNTAKEQPCVELRKDVAEYCLESAMMLRKRLEIAPNSPEYRRVCEVQTALEDSLHER